MVGAQLGPYRVESLLGVGGMGEVYRATDTVLGRQVAIKILPGDVSADPERLARFRREARILASLNHPNIGAIYGLETLEGPTGLDTWVSCWNWWRARRSRKSSRPAGCR